MAWLSRRSCPAAARACLQSLTGTEALASRSDVLVSKFPELVRAALDAGKTGEDALQAMFDAGEEIVLKDDTLSEVGACAVALLLTPGAKEELSVASVGDCAAVAAYRFEGGLQPHRMSGTPHNLAEGTQLMDALLSNRVTPRSVELEGEDGAADQAVLMHSPFKPNCTLQLSRALGDRIFKSPEPKKVDKKVDKKAVGSKRPRATDEARAALAEKPQANRMSEAASAVAFVVLCSDGITDHLSPDGEIVQTVAEHVRSGQPRAAAADALVARATERAAFKGQVSSAELRSMAPGPDRRAVADDMTATVVFIGPVEEEQNAAPAPAGTAAP